MHKLIAILTVAFLSMIVAAPVAQAAPTEVEMRIEGHSETLFEGPILVEPDRVQASSDMQAQHCDGINPLDPENTIPTPTPTSASADAIGLIGQTFDGKWYPGFEDYFVTRWGPDEQSVGEDAYWGVLVNDTFTNVGGCQYQLSDGDEVLWVYDAFKYKPILALFPAAAHYSSGTRPLTWTVALGEPLAIEVDSYEDDEEDRPPAIPGITGALPFEGAEVAPVVTTEKGFERVNTRSSATVTTDGQGRADITFTKPGWHRIKATVVGGGVETAIRSNRLDVCVTGGEIAQLEKPLEGASTCSETPAADRVRTAPPLLGEDRQAEPEPQPEPDLHQEETKGSTASTSAARGGRAGVGPVTGRPQVRSPKLDRGRLAKGRVGVSWKVQGGEEVAKWTISSLTVGRQPSHWVIRANGSAATEATVTLPKGHTYKLRLVLVGRSGDTSIFSFGKVKVPGPAHRER
ncbi:MAG TPA: DUF4430 domain-containing protein [Solirubrobacterales bacterium]|nr:DUF4430 domain-containing protein [Solirubrobacterales bacterium]